MCRIGTYNYFPQIAPRTGLHGSYETYIATIGIMYINVICMQALHDIYGYRSESVKHEHEDMLLKK